MRFRDKLDEAIRQWNALNHPFYRAWSEGTLPLSLLKTYAREYGTFIEELPVGWETLGDIDTAEEEREHFLLWEIFAHSLGTFVGNSDIPEVSALIKKARIFYEEKATAIGALYAFESQQRLTAKTKLEGLRKHYHLPKCCEDYFLVHASNEAEAENLLSLASSLSSAEQKKCLSATERMAKALWDALTGILDAEALKP